ncbi:MAG: hypothetical protein MI923_12350, partial [Phycisphaerales bacterium]|nr:hypothetical protein [Phycisphaerales bacterium]
ALALLVVSFSTTFFFLIVVLAYFISSFAFNVVERICNKLTGRRFYLRVQVTEGTITVNVWNEQI